MSWDIIDNDPLITPCQQCDYGWRGDDALDWIAPPVPHPYPIIIVIPLLTPTNNGYTTITWPLKKKSPQRSHRLAAT